MSKHVVCKFFLYVLCGLSGAIGMHNWHKGNRTSDGVRDKFCNQRVSFEVPVGLDDSFG